MKKLFVRTVAVGGTAILLATPLPSNVGAAQAPSDGSTGQSRYEGLVPAALEDWEPVDHLKLIDSGTAEYAVKTPPLRSFVRVIPPAKREASRVRLADANALGTAETRDGWNADSAFAPIISTGFFGMAGQDFGGENPPDPTGEAGKLHYVQSTNAGLAGYMIFDKQGNVIVPPEKLSTLWQEQGVNDLCATSAKGDPIVQYDQLAERWLLTQFAFRDPNTGPFFECVAVSTTPDPLGSYFLYSFPISDTFFPDYPKFGVWPDGYYMSARVFEPGGDYAGLAVVVFEREAMLRGDLPQARVFLTPQPDLFGALPSDVDGPTPPPVGSPNYLINVDDFSDQIQVIALVVDWVNPANTVALANPNRLQAQPFDSVLCGQGPNVPCVPQRETANRLAAFSTGPGGNAILMYRAAYRNYGTHESIVVNHTIDVGGERAAIRWYEIHDPLVNPFIRQQATYTPDDLHRWNGSIAMDRSGGMSLGFSVSGPNIFPSIGMASRSGSDPPGTLAETPLTVGAGSQVGSNRWGDYTHMSLDPTDDCTFWYTNEAYPQNSGGGEWVTVIWAWKLDTCDPSLPPPPDNTPPRIRNVADAPDPFTPNGDGRKDRVKISFAVDETSLVTIAILKRNNLVRELKRFVFAPGTYFVQWNGKDQTGARARSGKYSYLVDARDAAGNVSRVQKRVRLVR